MLEPQSFLSSAIASDIIMISSINTPVFGIEVPPTKTDFVQFFAAPGLTRMNERCQYMIA